MYSIWIGWDPHEIPAFEVARASARANCSLPSIPIRGVVLEQLQRSGAYTRPVERKNGVERPILWDPISYAPMSTEFAISRFFVPYLARGGFAMFFDCDVLVRGNISQLFQSLSGDYAVWCVKHDYLPKTRTKMDGQIQTLYARKNWSSVMIFNCDHPSNRKLTLDYLNTVPGRTLHAFEWLDDEEIGELPQEWNWLVGDEPEPENPKLVHWTLGGPWLERYKNAPYSDEWRETLMRHAA